MTKDDGQTNRDQVSSRANAAEMGGNGGALLGGVNPWIISLAVMSATFMEVLDTTVVNVSLPHIAGSLSATPDEATWSLTSYLVANAIVLPMTGWLANYFGRKRLLMLAIVGFTASSFLCGFAPSLGMLIVFRCLQGAAGGCLQPLSQAIMMESFPPEKRGQAMAMWALGIVVAPMLGPVVGGWLTDNYSWRWIFYINIPIGIFALLMVDMFLFDPPYIKRGSGKIDYWGMGMLVIGIGALQIFLDKGQEEDWFASHFIAALAVIAFVALAALIVWELVAEHPIVDLTVFRNRTYATGVFLMTVLGFVLYGSTVIVSLFMQVLLQYPALDAGVAMLPRGLGSFVAMPFVGYLMTKVSPKKMLAAGFVIVAYSLFYLGDLNLFVGQHDFIFPLVVQGTAMGLLFVPLTTMTNDPIPLEKMGNATSIFNLMRNIGGSMGIAATTTLLERYQQVHINELGAHVTPYSEGTQQMTRGLAGLLAQNGGGGGGAGSPTTLKQAYDAMWMMVQQQAAMLSYRDVFMLLGGIFIVVIPLVLLMRRPQHQRADYAAH